jgi:ABC-type dipeptide/oligopeptide/nickel transport system permease component
MYPEVSKKSLAQDREIIKSLNDCIFPSKYSDVGFVGPAPEGRADKAGQVISNLLVNTFVGDTQICYIGAQYPDNALYVFSHKRWADVFIIRKYFPKIRLAAAQSVMHPTTQVIRLMRASVAEVMTQNYIRAARIKGLSTREIVMQHVLRNAIPPIIPKVGVQLSSMLTLAIITESIFNWPGIGRWLLDALSNQDYVSIQAGVIVVATLVLTANILSDLLGAMVNPLVRKEWYANK